MDMTPEELEEIARVVAKAMDFMDEGEESEED